MFNSDKVFLLLDGRPEFKNLGMDQRAELFVSIANSVNALSISDRKLNVLEKTNELADRYVDKLGL